ncbi:MAG: RibD family protein [Pseudomonadota bacterium]
MPMPRPESGVADPVALSPDNSPDSPPEDWPALWQDMLRARADPQHAPIPGAPLAAVDGGWGLVGACSAASAAWFEVYKPLLDARLAHARAGSAAAARAMPWAVAQLGQSLDGCVATAAGDSYFVTGPESLVHLHRLRALCDAVLVGAGTVVADNPLLTTRHVPGPHPVRVVLDPAARLDGSARSMHDATSPTLWLCDGRHADAARARLEAVAAHALVEVLSVDGLIDAADPRRGPDMTRALAALAGRGLRVLLVEGGGVTVSRCLAAGVLDRLHLMIAPVIIGAGRRGLQHPGPARMADCARPPARRMVLGDDMLWDLDLRTAAIANDPAR